LRSPVVTLFLVTCIVSFVPGRASAEDNGAARDERPLAVGFQLDLFPTLVSAINGEAGYAPQVWLGIDHVRVRFVGAHMEPPDALAFADEGFENPTTTALAFILDYTFGDHFDGFWVCAGFETWQQTIEHEAVPERAAWTSVIGTTGGGYIWRFYGNFYVDPWAGVHWTMNPQQIDLGPYQYDPPAVVANASVKVGVFADL